MWIDSGWTEVHGLKRGWWLVALLAATACTPSSFDTRGHYTSKTPYEAPLEHLLPTPPEGFQPLMVQMIARHGSRPLSSPDDDDLSLQVWNQARADGHLTPLGERLGSALEQLQDTHQRLGYGAISTRGELEHESLAERMLARQPQLFGAAIESGRTIEVLHSGRDRAEQSAQAFLHGLSHALPDVTKLIETPRADPTTVYFHDAAETEAAVNYRRYRDEDPRLAAMLAALAALPGTREMAVRLLEPLYGSAFVAELAAGKHRFEAVADPEDGISSEVEAAASLYSLYSIAINLDLDADLGFGRFIDPAAAAWFAMIDDAETFYERGPGFEDERVTYAAAEVLLQDFFSTIEAVLDGSSTAVALLRFSHAQAIIPFATLLDVHGANRGLAEGVMYSYTTSAFRTAEISPMAANIQWDVYTNDSGEVLVRMLHNERIAAFAPTCDHWPDAPAYYALGELRRCYALPGD